MDWVGLIMMHACTARSKCPVAVSARMQYRYRLSVSWQVAPRRGLDWLNDGSDSCAHLTSAWSTADAVASSCLVIAQLGRSFCWEFAADYRTALSRRADERWGLCSWSADHITWHTVVSSHRCYAGTSRMHHSRPAYCICILKRCSALF